MANSYFQFKSFRILQDACAMKVCTEACLFGAWLADEVRDSSLEAALDIGTGTGLLSLLLAQTSSIQQIDAIELDAAAANQASANVAASPWRENVQVVQGDALQFPFPRRYSLVFSNPPFFEHSLLSPDVRINQAKHEGLLDLHSLVQLAERHTTENGSFAILLPYLRAEALFEKIRTSKFQLLKRLNVCQTEKHTPFRSFFLFSKTASGTSEVSTICIRKNGTYSEEFIRLLQPYYLYL